MAQSVDFLDFFDTVDDNWLAEFNESVKPSQIMMSPITTDSNTGDTDDVGNDCEPLNSVSSSKVSSHRLKNNRFVSSFKKPQNAKVVWSLSNSKRGKTYERYIERQLRIARRFCRQLLKVLNLHDISSYLEFVKYNFAENFIYHELVTGKNPFTGVVDSERFISGVEDFNTFILSFFAGVPDSALIIDSIEVSAEGKIVTICGTSVGTPIREVEFPEHNPNDNTDGVPIATDSVSTMPTENSAKIAAGNVSNINTFAFPFVLYLHLNNKNMLEKYHFNVTTIK